MCFVLEEFIGGFMGDKKTQNGEKRGHRRVFQNVAIILTLFYNIHIVHTQSFHLRPT